MYVACETEAMTHFMASKISQFTKSYNVLYHDIWHLFKHRLNVFVDFKVIFNQFSSLINTFNFSSLIEGSYCVYAFFTLLKVTT